MRKSVALAFLLAWPVACGGAASTDAPAPDGTPGDRPSAESPPAPGDTARSGEARDSTAAVDAVDSAPVDAGDTTVGVERPAPGPTGEDVLLDTDLVLTDARDLAARAIRPMTVSFFEAPAGSVGMDRVALEALDSLLLAAVADSVTPGAALAIGRRGRLVRLRGYGTLDWDGERLASPATLWDLASLTKTVGTTTAVMILEEEGRLELDAPVVRYLPWWSGGHAAKERVTLRQLLLHRGGLPAFRRWFAEIEGVEAYRRAIAAEPLESAPGETYVYSDIGAMTLAFVVEAVTGDPLDAFLERRVWRPLGMNDTGFLPDPRFLGRIAPTELDTLWRHTHVRGVVHDENADAMGGVAGHAGLFSTAWDLAIFARTLLHGGALLPCEVEVRSGVPCTRPVADTVRIVQRATVERYTRRHDASSSRALGWDTPEGRSSAGRYFTSDAFGHTGFTGTSIWLDPQLDLFVVLLTNRVNPTRAESRHVALRREVHDRAARAITDRPIELREGGS